MRLAVLAFVAGAAAIQTSPALPDAAGIAGCALGCLLAATLLRGGTRQLLGGLCFGLGWAAWLASMALADSLAPANEGRDIVAVGVVDSLPLADAQGVRFQFAIDQASLPGVPRRVALAWYAGRAGDAPALQPGQRWRLSLRLQRPHGNVNPYGFDYEAWLLEQGVRATGYVRGDPGSLLVDAFVARPSTVVGRVRSWIRERIGRALPQARYAAVIVALVIGDQRGIPQSDWTVFNRTGVSHLMSISGLHITMLAGLAAGAVSWLWRRSFFTGAALPLRLPAQKAAALAGALVALLYVLLAGFGVPAQRTLYMLMVVAAALWAGRITSVTHVLCAALAAVILLDPWAMLWPGFWLSFGAVSAILYVSVGRIGPAPQGVRGWLRTACTVQGAVTIGLVPLTMLLFSQVSLSSPIANALAIPVVSLVVTPLALAGALLPAPLAQPVLQLAHGTMAVLAALLERLAASPLAVWSAPAPPAWAFLFALAGTAWLLAPRAWPLRWTGWVSWLPLFAQLPASPPAGSFRITAFDVGQGMALLVETAHHRLLYDTGPAYAPGADAGSRVILPYLHGRGIAALDGMVISHSDLDHVGGALSILQGVRVGWLASSLPADSAVARAAPRALHCSAGQRWRWDGVQFEMLHPVPEAYGDVASKTNARSCTLRVSGFGRSMLMAGDIEAAQEAALVARGAPLRADVLLAPHHGSGTSSSAVFLSRVDPAIAVFQVGHRNRYRHPKAQVWQRYGDASILRLRTDELGAVTLLFSADGIATSSARRQQPRYWYGQ